MAKKSRPVETGVATVVGAKKDGGIPLAITLQTVEIVQCTIERKIPRSLAVKGKISTDLTLGMGIVDRNGRKGIAGLLKAKIIGRTITDPPDESFMASFMLEGLFYPDAASIKLAEKHLDRSMAERIMQELHPLSMLRASELLSMMGYGGVRLVYGTSRAKLQEMETATAQV
jgi:hypothetical protein